MSPSEILTKFIIWLLSPLGTALCLAGLALLLARRRRLRGSMALAALAFVWLWVWSTPMISQWLARTIEAQYPQVPIAAVPIAPALVVLGGAVAPPSGKNAEIDLNSALDRVWFAARLFHAGKAPLLLVSAGSDPGRYVYSEARATAAFLTDLGVPPQAMVLEERSLNTRQNAAFSAELLKARGITRILLVTSALHMPRAVALFEAQGLQVTPAPTDFEASQALPPGLLAWLPDALALDCSGRAMKEIVGKWVGW
ncbi:MAG: YdcF family protein [Rhodoferax sp.]